MTKVQVRFKPTKESKEKNYVYTAKNFLQVLLIYVKAIRSGASAILVFRE